MKRVIPVATAALLAVGLTALLTSTAAAGGGEVVLTAVSTDPALVTQWWGRGNKLVVERLEVRPGGHWRFVEHADGATHGFEGRFAEVIPQERVVQTFEWDGLPGRPLLQPMTLEALPDGHTRLSTVALFFTTSDRDGMIQAGMEGGMNESYAALDRLLAKLE